MAVASKGTPTPEASMVQPISAGTDGLDGHDAAAPQAPRSVRRLHTDLNQRPFMVIWETTRACQLACAHCRADSINHRNPLELSTEEAKTLLGQLASYGRPRPMVILTGGDPFERPDLAELTRYGTDIGLHMALSPSVTPKLTRQALEELRAAGGSAVSVSLDGAHAATHDAFRSIEGTYDRTLEAIDTVLDVGFRLQVNTTVTSTTVHELPQMLRQMVDKGIGLWSVFFLVPTGRGASLNALSPSEVEDVLHWLYDVSTLLPVKTTEAPHYRRVVAQRMVGAQRGETFQHGLLHAELSAATASLFPANEARRERPTRPPLEINAGRGFAFIDHIGFVYPSGFLPHQLGNVRQHSFCEIYADSPLLKRLRDSSSFDGKCGVCEFNDICGGSRSHSFAVTGNPLASDPTCVYQPLALTAERPFAP